MAEYTIQSKNTGKVTFQSALTDSEARMRLGQIKGEFARTLANKRTPWTASQRAWAHYLVWADSHPDQVRTTQERPRMDGLGAVVAFMDGAAESLAHPRVRLELPDGRPIVLSRAGAKSKHRGAVNITDGGPYGSNIYYGRISRDGTAAVTDGAVVAFLRNMAADVPATVAEAGKLAGRCCFCGRGLEDAASTAAGYGPTCAQSYGLPWGTK